MVSSMPLRLMGTPEVTTEQRQGPSMDTVVAPWYCHHMHQGLGEQFCPIRAAKHTACGAPGEARNLGVRRMVEGPTAEFWAIEPCCRHVLAVMGWAMVALTPATPWAVTVPLLLLTPPPQVGLDLACKELHGLDPTQVPNKVDTLVLHEGRGRMVKQRRKASPAFQEY